MGKSRSTKQNRSESGEAAKSAEAVLPKAQRRRNDAVILLSVAATLGIIGWLINGLPIGVRGEWTWETRVVIGARFWTPLGAVALLIAVAGWLTRPKRWEKTSRRGRVLWIIAVFLIAWLLALGFLGMPKNPAAITAAIIASPHATSYFNVATDIEDLGGFLREYPSLMGGFPLHAKTHPPGPVLFFYAVDRALEAFPALTGWVESASLRIDRYGTEDLTEIINQQFGLTLTKREIMAAILSAVLLAGVGSLSVFPLYLLASGLYGPVTGMRAILLFATIPSFLLFAPAIDQMVLFFAVLTLWGFHLLKTNGNPLVGVSLGLGLWVSVGLAVMGLFVLLWWVAERLFFGREAKEGADTATLIKGSVLAAALFLGVFILPWLALGIKFPEVISAGLAAHRHTTLEEVGRTYWKWIIYDPVEFAVFLGLPLTIWAIWGIRGAFGLAWIATLIILDLSGWVRAEAGRIWLFLMPPAAIIAADRLGKLGKRFDFGFFSALFLQLGQAVTMKAALDIFVVK